MENTQQSQSEYTGAFKAWWRKRSFYAKNFIVLDVIAVFFLMVALIASAATSNSSSSDTSPTYSSSSYSSGYSSTDRSFLSSVHQRTAISTYPDGNLVTYGHWICDEREAGFSESDVSTFLSGELNLSYYDASWLVGASEGAYCPAY